MKKVIDKLVDVKSLVTTLAVLLAAGGAFLNWKDELVSGISSGIYKNVTYPTYKIVEYDLMKQLEKLANDPEDIKTQDVYKFGYFCQLDYFKNTYAPHEANGRAISVACNKVLALYDKRLTQ